MVFLKCDFFLQSVVSAHLLGETHVERADRRDEAGHDERQDERLQHAQKEFAHVGDVHDLAVRPCC